MIQYDVRNLYFWVKKRWFEVSIFLAMFAYSSISPCDGEYLGALCHFSLSNALANSKVN
jgi:hypothetical protein